MMTREEALEHMALAVYQRRRRDGLLEYGDAGSDMKIAESLFKLFDSDFNGDPIDQIHFEDNKCHVALYEYLKTQMGEL